MTRWTALCSCFFLATCLSTAALCAPDEATIEALKLKALTTLKKPELHAGSLGARALITLALLKADVPATAPPNVDEIREILSHVKNGKWDPGETRIDIYEAGVCLMALANADKVKYRPQIQILAQYIVSQQIPLGAWDYNGSQNGDTSITQYGILGLWEASRCGIVIPNAVWAKAARWHIMTQQADNGFTYHPVANGLVSAGSSTHTMTVAGISSLYVCRLHLFPRAGGQAVKSDLEEITTERMQRLKPKYSILHPVAPEEKDDELPTTLRAAGGTVTAKSGDQSVTVTLEAIEKSIARGTQWLEARWTAEPGTSWKLYYLYGVERFGALAHTSQINGHDWYSEGVETLIRIQVNDGWGDGPATAFASMFLGKATAKMLKAGEPARRSRIGSGVLVGGRGLPANLAQLQTDKGEVAVRKSKGAVDELLAELEKAGSVEVESAQASIVDQVVLANPESLIGQKDRLVKLVGDKRPEVRRTALWALGRTSDLTVAPLLINGLNDADGACVIEAYAALRYLSRRVSEPDLPEEITPAIRQQQTTAWKKWYLSVRPYSERDDLQPEPDLTRPTSVVPKSSKK